MEKNIKQEIYRIKSDKDCSIPVHNYSTLIGTLRPITYYDIGNDEIIENLMHWRNQNISAYLSSEKATFEGTRRWLSKFVLDNESKILFLLYTDKNVPIGHIGLADGLDTNSYVEMDNIVRGIKSGEKGMITLALYDLISWVFSSFDYSIVYLRVFSDNIRAINLYQRLKFNEKKKYPLKKTIINNVVSYSNITGNKVSGKYFSYMELEKNNHFENYINIKKKGKL
jgi:RimJ/RimL family protein N-acetyltransferase